MERCRSICMRAPRYLCCKLTTGNAKPNDLRRHPARRAVQGGIMSFVRFAMLCDQCKRRSPEYTPWGRCTECEDDVCDECAPEADPETRAAVCHRCAEEMSDRSGDEDQRLDDPRTGQ